MGAGHLELIIGTMYSGKTSELITRLKRYEVARKVQLFKPSIDDRYGMEDVVSHDNLRMPAHYVDSLTQLQELIDPQTRVVGIDEAQFFEPDIVEFCDYLANEGRIVVAALLLKDFQDRPFTFKNSDRRVHDMIDVAEYVKFLRAICTYPLNGNGDICERQAPKVQRFVNGVVASPDAPTVEVGAKGIKSRQSEDIIDYEARCREHFQRYD